jgi:hypothetical protein
MAIRVTDIEVFEIIDTSLTNIDPFINSASLIVDGYLLSKGLSDEILKQIELYIAAHLLSLKDPRTKSVGVDVLSESYQGQWGLGLNGTSYGQTAILLDSSGTLGSLTKNGKLTTSFGVIGYHE